MIFYIVVLFTTLSFGQGPVPARNNEINKKLSEGVDTSTRRELTEEELMQKFFNKKVDAKPKKKSKIYFPVFYESMSRSLTQIQVKATTKITGLENLEIDANAMIAILNKLVDPAWLVRLNDIKTQCQEKGKNKQEEKSTADENICWVSIEKFADPDVIVSYNDRLLEIRIKVKPELRSVKIASLTHASSYASEITNEPTWFSSYINMNFTQAFQSDNLVFKNGREPIKAQFDSATHFGELLIEANGRSVEKRQEVESSEPDFVRENVRAVLDFPSVGIRTQVGDLTYPIRSFQAFRPMAGVSLFTQISLQSSQLILPGNNYDLNLARPSKVSIYINEKLIQIIELPAGRHNLRDFPFVTGQNDLKLEITDDLGRTEVSNYSVLLASELLKQGIHEISYSAGVPSSEVDGIRTYDSSNLSTSIFHRYGYSQNLTLGVNAQFDRYQTVGSLEFTFVTSLGYFSVEPAMSLNKDHPDGNALRFRYVVQDLYKREVSNKSTSFEASLLSSDFAQLGTRNQINSTALKLQINHSRSLSEKSNINLGLGYNFNRETSISAAGDSYFISVGVGNSWTNDLSSNFSLRHTKGNSADDDISINLFLLWSMPKEKQFVTASTGADSLSSNGRVDWTNYSTGGAGAYRSRMNIQNKSTGPGYGGDIEYVANRATMSASHQITIEKADPTTTPPTESKSVHSTSFLLGTSLVFAGGNFSLARPIYDSFVMFVPLKNIKDQNVQINPEKDGSYISETDWLGAAVAPEIPSYHYSNLKLGQEGYKQGVSLPKDHFTVKPIYRSGYAISIGTDATIYLKSKLEEQDGKPVSMIAAQAIYLDDKTVEPVTVFTNRNGLVRSEGFRHGRYKLEFSEGEYEAIEFEIPESASDEYELPVLKLKAGAK